MTYLYSQENFGTLSINFKRTIMDSLVVTACNKKTIIDSQIHPCRTDDLFSLIIYTPIFYFLITLRRIYGIWFSST